MPVHTETSSTAVFLLPDEAWTRRVSGVFGNALLVSSQLYNVVKYIMYVLHNQPKGIKNEEIHRDTY